jgi:hypothetical protein
MLVNRDTLSDFFRKHKKAEEAWNDGKEGGAKQVSAQEVIREGQILTGARRLDRRRFRWLNWLDIFVHKAQR